MGKYFYKNTFFITFRAKLILKSHSDNVYSDL